MAAGSPRHRQGEFERGAAGGVVRRAQLPAVRLNDGARDRQAHAQALALRRVQRLEDPFDVAQVDPRPGVLDRDRDGPGAGRERADREGGVTTVGLAHRLDAVEDHVEDHLLQLHSVAAHPRQTAGQLQAHRHVAAGHVAPDELGHFADDPVDVERAVLEHALLDQDPHPADHVGGPCLVRDDVLHDLPKLRDVRGVGFEELLARPPRC